MTGYAAVLFTPGSLEYDLVDSIMAELISGICDAKIIFKERVILTIEDLRVIYPKLVDTQHFPWVTSCFTKGESEYFLISGYNVHECINQMKGKFSFDYERLHSLASGLRERYQIDKSRFDFLFHSTDSDEETEVMGRLLFKTKWQLLKG